jgi:hypothetical protein
MHTKAITRSLEQLPKNESSQGTSIKDYEEHARYKWNTELQALQLYNPPDEVAYHDVSPIIGYHGNGLIEERLQTGVGRHSFTNLLLLNRSFRQLRCHRCILIR